jgi:hypothetical protein
MKTCETCKYWKHHGPRATWGSCERILEIVNGFIDIYPDLSDLETSISEHIDIPIVVDTFPTFGCLLWEEKQEGTMKCYLCKKTITESIRHFMPAKDNREKPQFRDLCPTCYGIQMRNEGYSLKENIWVNH